MFGKANWAVYKIDTTSLPVFQANLNSPSKLFSVSQLRAAAATRTQLGDFNGINPFSFPRLDETIRDSDTLGKLVNLVLMSQQAEETYGLVEGDGLDVRHAFASSESQFRLSESVPLYGLWFVLNEWKDVEDEASKKEDISYKSLGKPFKLTDAKQKQSITAEVKSTLVLARKQFPVIVDYLTGVVYIGNVNKGHISEVQSLLDNLGVKGYFTSWNFGDDSNWPRNFLGKMYENTFYRTDFLKYADESKMFNSAELAEGVQEEPILARILKRFFSMTQLDNEMWVGLSAAAQINLYTKTSSVGVKDNPTVNLLLRNKDLDDSTGIRSAGVTLQELSITTNKKGEEKVYRNDIVSMDISDEVNLVEVGVGLLRGFDLPSFKRSLRKDKTLTEVSNYWLKWLSAMNFGISQFTEAVATALDLPYKDSGLVPIMTVSGEVDPELVKKLREASTDNRFTITLTDSE